MVVCTLKHVLTHTRTLIFGRKMSQSRRYAVLATGPGEDADPLLDQDDDDDQLLDISSAAHLSRQENNAIGQFIFAGFLK